MPAPNSEIVRALFDAVAARDLDPMYEIYDAAVVIREASSLPYGGEYRGHDGIVRHGTAFLRTWEPFQGESERALDPEFFDAGEHVFVLWHHRARSPTGARLDLPATSVYRLRQGRIVTSTMHHLDTAALLRFLDEAQHSPGREP